MIITLHKNLVLVDIDGKRVTTFDPEGKTVPTSRKWFEPKREATRPEDAADDDGALRDHRLGRAEAALGADLGDTRQRGADVDRAPGGGGVGAVHDHTDTGGRMPFK